MAAAETVGRTKLELLNGGLLRYPLEELHCHSESLTGGQWLDGRA